MISAILIVLVGLSFGCSPKSEVSSSRSDSSETSQGSDETATVNGTVEQEDTGSFVDEINVDDWSTFEAQNTAGTNLLLTQDSAITGSEKVAIYKLGKDAGGTHDFFPESSVELSSDNTFVFKVQAYTYYVVKYKTLTGFVPALARDTILPLVLNAQSSIAVNLFIRMVQTEEGKALIDAKNIDVKVIESIAEKISSPGITDYKTVIDAVLRPVLAQQKDSDNNISKSAADIAAIVQKIIDVATTGDALTTETKNILKNPANERPTDISLSASSLVENAGDNAAVGTLSATDVDAGDTHTFTLVAGAGSTDNASFNISGTSLRATSSLNYESQTSYAVRVRATDNGSGALTFDKQLTITLTDVNEAPVDISLSASSIVEGQAINTAVGTLSSTDPDNGNTFTYSLVSGTGSTDNASFNISGTSLRVSSVFAYATKSSYDIRLRTTDSGTGNLTFEEQLTITVTQTPASNVMHIAFYDDADDKLKYMTGSQGSWGSPEVILTETRSNMDWENISLSLNASNKPHISYYSNNSGGSNGRITLYRKPAASWLSGHVINSHNDNSGLGFAQGRFTASGNMQFYSFNHPVGSNQTTLYYFDPAAMGTPSGVDVYYTFNRDDANHVARTCVDDENRLWFGLSEEHYNYASSMFYGYRSAAADPYVAGQTTSITFATDPCQEDIDAASFVYPQIQDIDCRYGQLTILVACKGSGGYFTRLKTLTKAIGSSAPNLAAQFTVSAFSGQPSFGAADKIQASIARTSAGALRLVTNYGAAYENIAYFNGTSWTNVWTGPGGSTRSAPNFAFSLDSDNNPHVVYWEVASGTSSKLFHWMHNGTSASTEEIYTLSAGTNIFLSPDLGIDGIEGKSNHN